MKIVLLGRPASGKSTISELLESELKIPAINVGDILRHITPESPHYKILQECMARGELAPEELVGKILTEVTAREEYKYGYILDGWFRQYDDTKYFDPNPDIFIYFAITESTARERVLARRICEKESHSYNLVTNPPKRQNICDIDGSILKARNDDQSSVLENRLTDFNLLTLPVIEFYAKKGLLIEISAEGTIDETFEKTLIALNQN